MDWYLAAMKKYADFEGRARRKEYWMFTLGYVVVYLAFFVLTAVTSHTLQLLCSAVLILVALIHLIPNLAVSVRRLHDTGRSGWWLLIGLVPLVGGIVMLVFLCSDSEMGANEYGPNPKQLAYAG